MFPYFEVLGKTIGSYAVCAIFGIILSGFTAVFLAKQYNIKSEDIIISMLVIVFGLLIGGHILFGITNIKNLIILFQNYSKYSFIGFIEKLGVYFGGNVFYGGFIGAYIAIIIYCKYSKVFKKDILLNIFAVCVPLFHAFGRIGCFMGGCCYGIESKWGFVVHNNTLQPEINDVTRLPVQLIESFCNILIFIILLYLFKKHKFEKGLIYIYMIIYPVTRFILEFFRGDEIRGFLFALSTSQWISIGLILFALIKLKHLYFKK